MRGKKSELTISILIPLAVGAVSALLTRNAMEAFDKLSQPPLSPPGWVFPVVWLVLYVLMGISSYRIYRNGPEKREVRQALAVYAASLVFNFFWSVFFFNLEWFLFAFLWLAALWVLILVMIQRFGRIDQTAARLQIPYLLWVTFAGYLNLGIFLLNR